MIDLIVYNNVQIKNVNVKWQGRNVIQNAILIITVKINNNY
jgi:hypothetical protein